MCSQHVLYTVAPVAVILTWNLGERAKEDTPHASTAEGFGRYKKARGRIVADPALCAVTLLLGLAQQAQTHGDKRQDNADDGLAAEQAAGNDQALLLEGGVLGSLLLV